MERCVGCGIEAAAHPVVGVATATEDLDAYAIVPANLNGFTAYGVCATCHTEPEHRVRTLKMTFFSRAAAADALARAGSPTVTS